MAIITATRPAWKKQDGELIFDYTVRMDNVLTVQKNANRLVKIPVAYGHAHYAVHSFYPLTLEWIPAGDSHRAPEALLRGLAMADLKKYGVSVAKVRKPKRVSAPRPASNPRPIPGLDRSRVILVNLDGGVVHQIQTNIPELKNVRFVFHVTDGQDLDQAAPPVKLPAAGRNALIYTVDSPEPKLLEPSKVKSIQRSADRYLRRRLST
jgi:hypothetical protein